MRNQRLNIKSIAAIILCTLLVGCANGYYSKYTGDGYSSVASSSFRITHLDGVEGSNWGGMKWEYNKYNSNIDGTFRVDLSPGLHKFRAQYYTGNGSGGIYYSEMMDLTLDVESNTKYHLVWRNNRPVFLIRSDDEWKALGLDQFGN